MNLRTSTLSWVIAPFAVCALLMRPSALDARELQTVRVATEQGVTRVFLDLSEAAPHRFFTLESPRRAVLDLERVTGVTAAMPAAQGSVVGVRTGTQPDSVLRVVVELQPGSRATLQPSLLGRKRRSLNEAPCRTAPSTATLAQTLDTVLK